MSAGSSNAATNRVTRILPHLVAEIALIIVRSALWVGFTTAGIALNIWAALMLLLLLTPESLWGYVATVFGVAVVGCIGGVLIGIGQVLALRRWLDGAASLGSFLSTVLASSAALAVGTGAGWWTHTVAGNLAGVITGLAAYGSVFGFVQRPMVDYMARHSLLWVPVNAVSSVLGAMAVLAAFDVSGGRRDMLQFRYAGIVYSLVVGAAFLWMTRETRKAVADRSRGKGSTADQYAQPAQGVFRNEPRTTFHPTQEANLAEPYSPLLEIREHRVYRVFQVSQVSQDPNIAQGGNEDPHRGLSNQSNSTPEHGRDGPDVIDTTYRVIS